MLRHSRSLLLYQKSIGCATANHSIVQKTLNNCPDTYIRLCPCRRHYAEQQKCYIPDETESNQVEGSGLIQLDKYRTFISQTVGKDDVGSIQYKDNEMRQRHIKTIQMEMRSSRESGNRAPLEVSDQEMQRLMEIKTLTGRSRVYEFIYKTQVSKLKEKSKAIERKIVHEARVLENKRKQENNELGSRIFFMIRSRSMNMAYYHNLAFAETFGCKVVFDMSFESQLTSKEKSSLVRQLAMCFSTNKLSKDPFHMILSGVNETGRLRELLEKGLLHPEDNLTIPGLTVTEKCYTELYPKEDIVYLTPNSHYNMEDYDHDAVYIIGGIVDLAEQVPVTRAKAKRQQVKTAKFPIDKYLTWKIGSKALPLNHVFGIMMDKKDGKNWVESFKHIQRRLYEPKDPSKVRGYR